jgi:ribonuclease III
MKQALIKTLGYRFKNPTLFNTALTHRSIQGDNNERLEFLGDSILNFIIAHALFNQFPHASEGFLSRVRANLVNEDILAAIAIEFQLGKYLNLGSGELKSGGMRRKSILADALEAIIGAIYLDSDIAHCEKIIMQWFASRLANVDTRETLKDAKSRLQEYLQSHKLSLPIYSVTSTVGEPHAQEFFVSCAVPTLAHVTKGSGSSRREAEQKAAAAFLEWIATREK